MMAETGLSIYETIVSPAMTSSMSRAHCRIVVCLSSNVQSRARDFRQVGHITRTARKAAINPRIRKPIPQLLSNTAHCNTDVVGGPKSGNVAMGQDGFAPVSRGRLIKLVPLTC